MPKSISNNAVVPEATLSSGNVFADMGLPNADELLLKAGLAMEINGIIHERKLTQTAAAGVLGLHQPEVSLLSRGRLQDFSIERLVRCLRALDASVEFRVQRNISKPPPAKPRKRSKRIAA